MARINFNAGSVAKQLENAVKQKRSELAQSSQALAISKQIMASEAARLAKCIQRQIDIYYAQRDPAVYERTGELREAIEASPSVSVSADGKTLEASVIVKTVPGQSLFDGESVDRVAVIDKGWIVKKDVWFRDIEHFGSQAGSDFIKKGMADFEKSNPYGLKVIRP